MRYEDASHTGAFQGSEPIANDDLDAIAAGQKAPATGNLITGEGTQTGSAGADSAAGAHITAIAGKGGEDSSFAAGKLSVAGEHGKLSVDADGNYSYLANAGVENVRDRFTYTLADNQGNSDTAALIVEIGKTPVVIKADAQQIVVGPDGVVTLPPGVELSDIMVVGRNLVINMPDGTQLIIIDGAIFVPQLVLNGVTIPATNVAALLIGQEVQPAAGETPQSGGGNFALPPPPLDPGVPLGDLIPPTELFYVPPEPQEVFQPVDNEPEIFVQPDGQPASVSAVDQVEEAGLPTRNGGEPAGSGESADGNGADNDVTSETTTGNIIYDSPDTPNTITINGVEITSVNQVISGAFGELTITSIAPGVIGYSYTLLDNTSGNNTHDDFEVVLTDVDGDVAVATLVINIIDDVPTARNDTDATVNGVATGNVMTDAAPGDTDDSDTNAADTVGADDATLTSVSGTGGSDSAFSGGFLNVNGSFGSLAIDAQGNYTYTVNPNAGGGGVDVFTYTLTDGDGDTTTATLTITNPDLLPNLPDPAAVLLDDDALANGNPGGVDDNVDSQGTPGVLAGTGGDGDLDYAFAGPNSLPAGFTVNPVNASTMQILQGATVVLTVTLDTETGAFSVVQNNPIDHPAGLDENNLSFGLGVQVVDADGDTEGATITINVDDDTPEMNRVDVSLPTLVVDETNLTLNDSDDFSVIFDGDYGADGAGTTSYAVSTVNGTNSGLVDVATDLPVLLYNIGGAVVGSTSVSLAGVVPGNTVFTVSVNSGTGVVTLDQSRAVFHPDNPNPNEPVSPSATSIQLTASITDGDGDTDSLSVNIGNNLVLLDDGPSVDVTLSAAAEPTLTTDDTETDGTPTTQDSATASFAANFSVNASFGADGAGTQVVSYALGVSAPGVDSGLEQGGVAINLYLIGGVVVGSTAPNAGAVLPGNTVFNVSVDAAGNVTLTQFSQIDHESDPSPTGSPFADDIDSLADSLVTLTATATVTDDDGDPVTDSATLNIGANLRFVDDGPDVNAVLTGALLKLDETDGVGVPTEVDPAGGNLGTITVAAATLVTITNPNLSADTPTTNSYALVLSAPGVASGLLLSSNNASILLFQVGNTVEGRTGNNVGPLAFTISIDPVTGAVTMTQFLAVEHPTPGASHDEDSSALAAGALSLQVTATDFDGDTDVASVDLGSVIRFEDDGPSAVNDVDTIVGGNGPATGNVLTGVDFGGGDANATDGSADNVGSDTPGSITAIASNNVPLNVDTDPSANFTIAGQYGVLTLNANGNYSYLRNDGSPGGVNDVFTYTLTDADGDTTTATLTISIIDNFPAAGNVNVQIDDDDVVGAGGNPGTPAVGDDAPSGTAGNLPGSGGDAPLTWDLLLTDPPVGFSYVDGPAGAVHVLQGTTHVVTITIVPATGAYTVTQVAPIDHPDGLNENNVSFTVNYTVTDADNDVANGTINVNVDDDTPTVDVTLSTVGEPNLITQDSETDGVPTAQDSSSASFAANFTVTASDGADGPASPVVSYALGVSAPGVDSGLDQGGATIFLYLIGGVVVGSTSATQIGVSGANTVFDVTVNGSGLVTLTQYSQIDHPPAGDPSPTGPGFVDHVASLTDTLVTLTASATITDGDNDPATDSQVLNIGANLRFQDDGPDVAAVLTGTLLKIDETDGVTTGTEVDVAGGNLGTVTVSAATLFTVTQPNVSADTPTTLSYALVLSSNGVPSGLLLSTTNAPILLFNNAGVIEGRTGNSAGPLAFTISIDPVTGAVTMTQLLAVEHPTPGASHDEDSSAIAAGALSVQVTATDFDGDTDQASVDLGSVIRFEDDGPTIDVTVDGQVVEPILITQDAETDGVPTPQDSASSAANFGGVFGLTFTTGSDGAATPTLGYTLGVTSSVSGLTQGGVAINLYLIGGVVVGSTAPNAGAVLPGNTVFNVTVSGTGVVTLTQFSQIDHTTVDPSPTGTPFVDHVATLADGLVTLTASSTVTDNDGDTDSDSETVNIGANLVFQDDGPDVAAVLTGALLKLDETDGVGVPTEVDPAGGNLGTITVAAATLVTITNPNLSADTPTTNSYALVLSAPGVASGLLLSSNNASILLFQVGNTVEGRTGNNVGPLAFTISIDPVTGAVTMTQFLAVEHPTPGASHDEDSSALAAGALSLQVTATDFDGDTDVASVDLGSVIRFEDDGPSATNDTDVIDQNSVGPATGNVMTGVDIGGGDANATDGNPDNVGSDTPGSITFIDHSNAAPGAVVPGGGSVALAGQFGTLTIHSNGNYSYLRIAGQGGGQSEVFTYTLTDADGDTTTATLTITIGDDITAPAQGFFSLSTDDFAGLNNQFYNDGDLIRILQTGAQPPYANLEQTLDQSQWAPGNFDIGIDALHAVAQNGIYYSTESGTSNGPGGVTLTPNADNGANSQIDIFFWNGSGSRLATLALDGPAFVFPEAFLNSAEKKLDALHVLPDGADANSFADGIIFSLTTSATLAGLAITEGDLVRWDGTTATMMFDAETDFIGAILFEGVFGQPSFNPTGATITSIDKGVGSVHIMSFGADGIPSRMMISVDGVVKASDNSQFDGTQMIELFRIGDQWYVDEAPFFDSGGVPNGHNSGSNIDAIWLGDFNALPVLTPPVVLDLDGDGVEFLSQAAGVSYDYGRGLAPTAWVGPDDGILVRDANGNGTVDGASEFVFGGNGQTDLQALAAQYGSALDAGDADYAKFGVWRDANSNGAVDAGEYQSLTALGITSIGLVSDGQAYSAAGGDVHVHGNSSYIRADGSSGDVADAVFVTGGRAAHDQVRVAANSNSYGNTGIVAGALAAAGMSSLAAASTGSFDHSNDYAPQMAFQSSGTNVLDGNSIDFGSLSQSFGSRQMDTSFNMQELMSSGHGFDRMADVSQGLDGRSFGDAASAYQPNFDIGQTFGGSSFAAIVPSTVGIPSANAMLAAGMLDNAQHGGAVEKVLVDALGHGAAPTIDGLLAAFSGGAGQFAAIAKFASPAGDAVPAWDIGRFEAFGSGADMMMKVDAAMLHHDAVQPAVNG